MSRSFPRFFLTSASLQLASDNVLMFCTDRERTTFPLLTLNCCRPSPVAGTICPTIVKMSPDSAVPLRSLPIDNLFFRWQAGIYV